MNWLLFWMAIYLAVVLLLAFHHLKSSNPESYLVNNRSTGLLLVAVHLLALLPWVIVRVLQLLGLGWLMCWVLC